ncbi:MAG: acyl carrier protein [Blastomonas fulva]|uniref:acyl carrier protein n=1 Tax=Blastomonas fulva TaxID=1550728 RepID=UPI004033A8D1
MTDSPATYERIAAQIEPFNKKGVALTDGTTFAGDLEWDSLTVMDFVAAIEDEFDIIITMNIVIRWHGPVGVAAPHSLVAVDSNSYPSIMTNATHSLVV